MKKRILLALTIAATMLFAACGNNGGAASVENGSYEGGYDETSVSSGTSVNYSDYYSAVNEAVVVPENDAIDEPEVTDEFTLTTKDGAFTVDGNVYTITAAGKYTASGALNGQILVNAGEEDEVELVLSGASIVYDKDSPIKVVSADKLELSANKNTANLVKDERATKTVDSDEQGEGAISAACDLKLKSTGTLVVVGGYNNGVHTKKDLTIQKLTLQVTAVNNALKGKDSVTILSGNISVYSTNGDGVKTEDTDVSSKGNQRGTIEVDGGTLYVDVCGDALQAAYNVVIKEADETVPTVITLKTGRNSSYAANYKSCDSWKGVKAENEIFIEGGTIYIAAYDDAVHANYGTALENGETGLGNITVSGGVLKIASGDDGIHADNTLTISGGANTVTNAQEGLEANHIVISGGYTKVYGSDDGVNASKKINETPSVLVAGGVLDVAVSNGDTDGIDSNGTFKQTGGVIISRGSPGNVAQGMSTALDVDGTVSITGGTFIAFNGTEKTPSTASEVLYAGTSNSSSSGWGGSKGGHGGPGGPGGQGGSTTSSYTFASGTYTLTSSDGEMDISFSNDYQYATFMVYSSELNTGATYTLSKGGTSVLSWTQSSAKVTIG